MNYEVKIKNKKKYKALFVVVVFIILYSLFSIHYSGSASAQYGFTQYLPNSPGGEYDVAWLFRLLSRLTCYFIQFAIITFGVMLVVYGLMFFKSRGTPQGMTEAKKALTSGLVGGFVVFAVFTIILSLASTLEFFTGSVVDYPITTWITCS